MIHFVKPKFCWCFLFFCKLTFCSGYIILLDNLNTVVPVIPLLECLDFSTSVFVLLYSLNYLGTTDWVFILNLLLVSAIIGELTAPTGADPIAMMEYYVKKAAQEERKRQPKQSKDEMPPPASLQGSYLLLMETRNCIWLFGNIFIF